MSASAIYEATAVAEETSIDYREQARYLLERSVEPMSESELENELLEMSRINAEYSENGIERVPEECLEDKGIDTDSIIEELQQDHRRGNIEGFGRWLDKDSGEIRYNIIST